MFIKIILFIAAYIIISRLIRIIIRSSQYRRDRQSSFRKGAPQGKFKQENGIEDADYEEID